MTKIFLVTGNPNKLDEWRRQLPSEIEIDSMDVDLPEIQSLDPMEIVTDKAKRAFKVTGKPVVVEDVSAGLEKLNGLPGPFIKFFMKKLGDDVLYDLAGRDGESATVSCAIAYYDGTELVSVQGDVNGSIVQRRGGQGFGFDGTFVPEGSDRTYAEMSDTEKDGVSHRSVAIKLFIQKLKDLR
jgi:non-canonical purine NTP pyrophosphatase (RdgB/HAM1 family)